MDKGRMKVRVLAVQDAESLEEELNDILKGLAGHYIMDIKSLGKGLVAVMYSSEKKSSYREDGEE